MGIHQTADSVSAPRVSQPPVGSLQTAAPIACDGITPKTLKLARTVAGQEYRPVAGHGHTGSCPVVIADCFSLHDRTRKNTKTIQNVRSCFFVILAHPGAVANVAYAHHNNNRKVSDEWVFGYQGTNPFTADNGKQVKHFGCFTCFLTKRAKVNPLY